MEAPCPALVRFTLSINIFHENLIFVFELGQGTGENRGGGNMINEVESAMNMNGNGGGSGGVMNELEQFTGMNNPGDGRAGGGFF